MALGSRTDQFSCIVKIADPGFPLTSPDSVVISNESACSYFDAEGPGAIGGPIDGAMGKLWLAPMYYQVSDLDLERYLMMWYAKSRVSCPVHAPGVLRAIDNAAFCVEYELPVVCGLVHI